MSHLFKGRAGPKNILVRMPNWIGDCVMATPVLRELKEAFPQATLTAMAESGAAELLQEDPFIDELYRFSRPSGWLHRQENRQVIQQIQKGGYDLGVLLTNSFSSAWWFWRGKVSLRLGYAMHGRSFLLSEAVPPSSDPSLHQVASYQALLEPLGISASSHLPCLYLSEEEKEGAKMRMQRHGIAPEHIVVGINPGAAYGSAKCWLPSRFRHLTSRLLENPLVRVVYFGTAQQKQLLQDICVGLPPRVINLAGETSVRELMALIDHCDIFLSNDSGPMHIASALDTPLLALFGSTSPVKTGPFGRSKVIDKEVECSPCFKRECPIDFRCMTRIEVEEVYTTLQQLIQSYVQRI